MKRLALTSAISLALVPLSSQALSFADARIAAMGGAAIASGDFTNAKHNPALLTQFDENDDFYFQLGLGAQARNYEDAVDLAEDTQDDLDEFEALVESNNFNQADANELNDRIIAQLKELDQYQPELEAGAILSLQLPSKNYGLGLSINTHLIGNGQFDFNDADETLLDDAIDSGELNQDGVQSAAQLNAVAVSEIALHFAHEFSVPALGPLSLGLSPKMQRFDTVFYGESIANFEEDDVDADDQMTDQTEFNLDLGLYGQYNQWRYGLVARNLISQELENANGDRLELKPSVTLGTAFVYSGLTAALDLDLTVNDSFDTVILASRYARLGLAYDFAGHAQLRAGFRHDLEGNYDDLFSVGVGLSPGDAMSLDLTGLIGKDDELGGVIQWGLKF